MEAKTCEICGRTLPLSAFSKSYKERCKECVARLTKEKRNGTKTDHYDKHIDWEQRRYEIAKEMLSAIYVEDGMAERAERATNSDLCFEYKSLQGSAKEAVRYADALIEELKKQDNG